MATAYLGGELCNFLTKGMSLTKFWLPADGPSRSYTIKAPLRGLLVLPPSVGQVLFGVMARAVYGSALMDHYPIVASQYIRNIFFGIILIRGALEVKLTGIVPMVLALSIVPAIVEACVTAAIAQSLFEGMPTHMAYALGYMLAYLGTGVTLPSIFNLIARGFKMKNALPSILVVSSTLDNLIGGTVFSIFKNLAIQETSDVNDVIRKAVAKIFIAIAIGLAAALVILAMSLPLKLVKSH